MASGLITYRQTSAMLRAPASASIVSYRTVGRVPFRAYHMSNVESAHLLHLIAQLQLACVTPAVLAW